MHFYSYFYMLSFIKHGDETSLTCLSVKLMVENNLYFVIFIWLQESYYLNKKKHPVDELSAVKLYFILFDDFVRCRVNVRPK